MGFVDERSSYLVSFRPLFGCSADNLVTNMCLDFDIDYHTNQSQTAADFQ